MAAFMSVVILAKVLAMVLANPLAEGTVGSKVVRSLLKNTKIIQILPNKPVIYERVIK